MKKFDWIILAILILAAICWGVWGVFSFELINYIIKIKWISNLIYIIMGFSGIYFIVRWKFIYKKTKKTK